MKLDPKVTNKLVIQHEEPPTISFNFLGRLLALAVIHQVSQPDKLHLEYRLDNGTLAELIGRTVTISNLAQIDPDADKKLQEILKKYLDGSTPRLTMSYIDNWGKKHDLEVDGGEIAVRPSDRMLYKQKYVEYVYHERVREELKAMKDGFNSILPKDIFNRVAFQDLYKIL